VDRAWGLKNLTVFTAAPGRSGCLVRANMATKTDHRISNSRHKKGVNGHFGDDGKRTQDNF